MAEGERVHVQLLASPRARIGEKEIPFIPDKRYQLLAYLVYQGEWISRDRAAFLFWPDTDSQNAKQNLRGLLQRVRSLEWLAGLESDAHQLRWHVQTDVIAFRQALEENRLDEAISYYSGTLLEGMDSSDAPEFSSWLDRERETLHAAWRAALLHRVNELTGLGQQGEAARLLSRLLEQDTFDEEALQAYMRATALASQKHEALRAYRNFASKLKEELKLEPTSTTQHLKDAIEAEAITPLMQHGFGEPFAASTLRSSVVGKPVASSPMAALPNPKTPFVGREIDRAKVAQLLAKPDCRLLTLIGAGGIGKTRLALQVAQELVGRYQHGTYFVPLESLFSARAIPSSIAAAVGIGLQGNQDPFTQIAQYLSEKQILLVLDNFEQLIEGAPLVSDLVQSCPNMDVLVTSRERLNLEEEWLVPVEGLAQPSENLTIDEAYTYDAVQLFVQRAQRVLTSFRLTEQTLPHVLNICRLVEGSPLGVELAAVWTRTLFVEEIAREIGRNLDFLTTASRNVTERQKSLRAAFEHSWQLLSLAEKKALRKLSVFRGGFRKDAAAYVAGASIAVLAALMDKSLLRVSDGGRYDIHPLIQQFTREKLQEHKEEQSGTRKRHFGYYLALAEQGEARVRGPEQTLWSNVLAQEHDNFRAALDWSEASNQWELELQLAGALRWFWEFQGHIHEGRQRLGGVLSQPRVMEHTLACAKALNGAGGLARVQADYASARPLLEKSLEIYRELGDKWGTANSLRELGFLASNQADYASARSLLEECLAVHRELGDKWGTANSLQALGRLALFEADYASARPLFEKSLAIYRELADKWGTANSLQGLGYLALFETDYASARSLFEKSLAIYRELADKWGTANSLQGLGYLALFETDYASARSLLEECLAIRQALGDKWGVAALIDAFAALEAIEGKPEQAARLWGAAEAVRKSIGTLLTPRGFPRFETHIAAARAHLGEDVFRTAWAEGQMLPLEIAFSHVRKGPTKVWETLSASHAFSSRDDA